ncbi:MAG: VTT domain-containing protein [Rhizomicrobium sp.]
MKFSCTLRNVARVAAVVLVVAGVVCVYAYRDIIDPFVIHRTIKDSLLAPVIFIGVQVLASLLFVPRSVIGVAAGLLFGMFWGLLWAAIGAVIGAAVGFGFVRWLGAKGTLDAAPKIGKLMEKAEGGRWRTVAIIRLLPFPHSVVNTALALTKISWRDYLIGSTIGMLPMTIAQVGIGAAGGAVFTSRGGWTLACLILAAAFGLSFLLKRLLRPKSSDTHAGQ